MTSSVLAGSPAPTHKSDLPPVQNAVTTEFDASGAGEDGFGQ